MRMTTVSRAALAAVLMVSGAADVRSDAFAALATIDGRYALPKGIYREHVGDGNDAGPSSAWAAGIQLSALNAAARLDPARLQHAVAYVHALDVYRGTGTRPRAYQPLPGRNGGDLYYDDNAWFVLAFIETYELTQDASHLGRAIETFDFVVSGESDQLGGGIYWRADQKTSKNTCSNAPAICAALELHRLTGEAKYRAAAERLYAWTNARLQDGDGLYFDAVRLDGSLDRTKWSYNSALMIRANTLLHTLTRRDCYLAEAQRIARAAEARWFRASDGALQDEASFAHLLCEALLGLHVIDRDPTHLAVVTRALETLRSHRRDGLYPKRWDGWREGERKVELLTQASAARAFLVAARHAEGPSSRPATGSGANKDQPR